MSRSEQELHKQFRREITRLVIPSVLQMVIGNSFSLLNTIMVGRLGDTAIAVVAATGQIGFILSMILSAVYGITAYITQFHGKRDQESVKKAFGLMLLSSVLVTLTLLIIIMLFRSSLLSLFVNDPQAAAYGVQYLSVLMVVYLINSFKDVYGQALGAIGRNKLTLVVGLIAMSLNAVLDYALIYGKLGFASYGIQGAAWATLAASVLSTLLLLGYVYGKKYYFHITMKELLQSFNLSFAKKIYATTLPLILHEGLWSVGNMLYAVAFGYMGVSALATFQLARTFNGYFMMVIFGFAYAAKVMIGQKLAQDDSREALIYAKKFTRLSVAASVVVSALILSLNPVMLRLFSHTSSDVQTALHHIMIIQAAVMSLYFLNNVWIVGMFRAGGDNVYTMRLIGVTTWVIALPLVFAGAYLFHWPIEVVYFMFAMEEISKAFIGYFRYRSKRWANNLISTMDEEREVA
ncbi:MATE family efflux transporter [Paenibacillus albus]|nr:MATE family efflux transporter [Paenibacillus albus]